METLSPAVLATSVMVSKMEVMALDAELKIPIVHTPVLGTRSGIDPRQPEAELGYSQCVI